MLFNDTDLSQLYPNNGLAKVYHKNLILLLQNLQTLNPIFNKTEYINHITQANDLLIKLKKADEKFDCTALELNLKHFEDAFYKVYEIR
jgi:hypothetical protein